MAGRLLKADEVLIVSEVEKNKIAQSGGLFVVIESVIPNPLKQLKDEAAKQAEEKQQDPSRADELLEKRRAAMAKAREAKKANRDG